MSKRERPRAIPRTGADLARAARAAKAAIGARLPSSPRPAPEPELTAKAPQPTGGYAGVIGAPPTVDRRDLPPEERPGVTTTWIPFPSFTSQPVLPPIPDSKE